MEFEIDRVMGLPAHALIVHAAVVLVPLAATGLVLIGWNRRWRQTYGLVVAAIAIAGAGACWAAVQSGPPLADRIDDAADEVDIDADFDQHEELGRRAFTLAATLAVAAVLLWATETFGPRYALPGWSPLLVYGASLVVAGGAVLLVVLAGHSGAELVWKDLGTFRVGR